MSIERVKEYFEKYNMAERVQEFEVSSATVELAAIALNCEGCRIAKSLTFKVDEKPIMIVVAGDAKIDNPKYKAQFSTKAKMLTAEEAVTLIGHAVGGVCPFAVNVSSLLAVAFTEIVIFSFSSSNVTVSLTHSGLYFGTKFLLDSNVVESVALNLKVLCPA